MGDAWRGDEAKRVSIGTIEQWNALLSRRGFMRLMGLGGALVLLPGIATSCGGGDAVTGVGTPGSGDTVAIDFAAGDVAVLQFAYVLEQLEADFYSRVVSAFTGSNFTAAEQTLLTDIRNHEVIHRDFFKALLGSNGEFTITPTYSGLNFQDRATFLAAAKTFEDLGVAAYNGAAQYLTTADNLTIAGKIVSVEARHASAIRDLLNPKSADFAPRAFDDALSPIKSAAAAQDFIVDKLAFANAPAVFVPGLGTG
ncbi:MAG: ferritin-like domain-containing protein [Gemmatimonadaceae bacterium]